MSGRDSSVSVGAKKVLFQSDGDFTVTITDPASTDAIMAPARSIPTRIRLQQPNGSRERDPRQPTSKRRWASAGSIGLDRKPGRTKGNSRVAGTLTSTASAMPATYAFHTGMEQVLYESGNGKNFTYSVRMAATRGATVDVSGAANLDAALSQIHTAFNAYKQSANSSSWRSSLWKVPPARRRSVCASRQHLQPVGKMP